MQGDSISLCSGPDVAASWDVLESCACKQSRTTRRGGGAEPSELDRAWMWILHSIREWTASRRARRQRLGWQGLCYVVERSACRAFLTTMSQQELAPLCSSWCDLHTGEMNRKIRCCAASSMANRFVGVWSALLPSALYATLLVPKS